MCAARVHCSRWPSGDGKLVLDHVEIISARLQAPLSLILAWLFSSLFVVSFSLSCAWVCAHARSASLEEEEEETAAVAAAEEAKGH